MNAKIVALVAGALLVGATGGGGGGYLARTGEVDALHADVATAKKKHGWTKEALSKTEDSLSNAEADVDSANDRIEICKEVIESHEENMLIVLDGFIAATDSDYWSALDSINSVEVVSKAKRKECFGSSWDTVL